MSVCVCVCVCVSVCLCVFVRLPMTLSTPPFAVFYLLNKGCRAHFFITMGLHVIQTCGAYLDDSGGSSSTLALWLSIIFAVYIGLSILLAASTIVSATTRASESSKSNLDIKQGTFASHLPNVVSLYPT